MERVSKGIPAAKSILNKCGTTTRKIFILVKEKTGKDLYILNYSDYCFSLLASKKVGKNCFNIGQYLLS